MTHRTTRITIRSILSILSLALSSVVMPVTSASADTNLVGNPGFEAHLGASVRGSKLVPPSIGNWVRYNNGVIGSIADRATARLSPVVGAAYSGNFGAELFDPAGGGGALYQDIPSFPAASTHTLTAWVYPVRGEQAIAVLSSWDRRGTTTAQGDGVAVYPRETDFTAWGQSARTTAISYHTWHELQLVLNSTTHTGYLYIDGRPAASTSPGAPPNQNSTTTLAIGATGDQHPDQFFWDDVSLTPSQAAVVGQPAGGIDPSFSGGGAITFPNYLLGYGLGLQTGGRLVVAGAADFGNADAALTRLLPNGSVDTTFGSNGTVLDSTLANSDVSDHSHQTLAIQPDGKIVVSNGPFVARYDADGLIDTTFGNGGYVDLSKVSTFPIGAQAVTVEGNGDVVIGGTGGNGEFAVERLTSSGVPDGYYAHQFDTGPNQDSQVTSLVVQPNGAVVAAGFAGTPYGGGDSRVVVARVIGGGPDPSFGNQGYVISQLGTGTQPWSVPQHVALAPDGRIVVAGLASQGGTHTQAIALARYTTDGKPDLSFGSSGHELSSAGFGSSEVAAATGLGVQADGDLVVSNTALFTGSVLTARYLPDGSLDLSYGRCGVTQDPFVSEFPYATGLLLQPDGKIDVAGNQLASNAIESFVARFVGGVAAASIAPGWTDTFGIPLPPPPPARSLAGSPDATQKLIAAFASEAMHFTTYLGWGASLGLLLVPVVGEEIGFTDLVGGADVVSFLVGAANDKIANDPPARNYRAAVRLSRFNPPTIHAGRGVSPTVAAAFNRYASDGTALASLELAYVAAAERAEGAHLAGNAVWFARQTRAARSFLQRTVPALGQFKADSTTLATRLSGTPLSRFTLTATQIAKARQAIVTRGLPASIVTGLRRLGLSRAEITAGMRSTLSHPSPRRLTFMSLLSSKPVMSILTGATSDSQATAACSTTQ